MNKAVIIVGKCFSDDIEIINIRTKVFKVFMSKSDKTLINIVKYFDYLLSTGLNDLTTE